jgi:small subunit ribosomal protein S17
MENKVEKNNKGKILKGVIVSAKMKDSIVVSIDSFKKHPKYGKFINKQNKIMAHDEGNKHKEGEVVEIIETRPISKNKKFRVL